MKLNCDHQLYLELTDEDPELKALTGKRVFKIRARICDIKWDSYHTKIIDDDRRDKIDAFWNWICYDDPFVAVRPDGSIWGIDGQGRVDHRERYEGPNTLISLKAFESSGREEEAVLCHLLNSMPTPATKIQSIAMADEVEGTSWCNLRSICQQRGFELRIDKSNTNCEWSVIKSSIRFLSLYEKSGDEVISWALDKLREIWGSQDKAMKIEFISGLVIFWQKYHSLEHFDEKLFDKKAKNFSASKILEKAFEIKASAGPRASIASCISDKLRQIYNYRLTSGHI